MNMKTRHGTEGINCGNLHDALNPLLAEDLKPFVHHSGRDRCDRLQQSNKATKQEDRRNKAYIKSGPETSASKSLDQKNSNNDISTNNNTNKLNTTQGHLESQLETCHEAD
ncbi:hypothetical protein E2C01_030069 [Portunus trituberculatus]|uniref:Uncharacterized protein n=1 Tax=Portunus trituberculatus TaxID=210409 RepID=A0A5B7ETX6_PORTR|nr:hypothetical protein [Portunus trituberculatus]